MTPEARIATAAELLDAILQGQPAEQALTTWARRSRFAGSKDRAAIRDHVFDALRCRRSYAYLGGAEEGRALMLGHLIAQGIDPKTVFTGQGHAPSELTEDELARAKPLDVLSDAPEAVAGDMPDWLWPLLRDALGDDTPAVADRLRHRAPVFLRVNLAKTDVATAQASLTSEGIDTQPHSLADTALEVTSGARQVARSRAYMDGWVELQDAASQAVTAALPLSNGMKVLDYCAGGGGKTLSMAGRVKAEFTAHDANRARLNDLPDRARRAGVQVRIDAAPKGPYDLILCDVPCSGSGSWRRSPEGKWALTPDRLADLTAIQSDILSKTAPMVAPGGTLAYATCSLLRAENEERIAQFLHTHPDWQMTMDRRWSPLDGGDGFFLACLTRA
ncbi:RsmB/NOP family class I SAM-dependent RNA methyltransferase [Pseudooceanicola sp. MF1-13]|uniref:RsmB/NOP family class I SAM-dependent RNA methyltransferase n=1 Tax=Pseudooceanicola sp. MF1-13 TaxID=3379095 RepID=UPI0038915097